ncbi:hypothetical protein B0A55_09723, partial [Friedmanniomyces simplex]
FGSVYFLTGATNIVWGKVYKYFPLKTVFMCAIALFELGSLLCGVSPNTTALIIGRAIAGVGAAGLQAGGNTIVGFTASAKRRPVFLGGLRNTDVLGACYTISSALGPIIGGALTSQTTWRWCFYINLPIGGLAFVAVLLAFRTPKKALPPAVALKEKLLSINPVSYAIWCTALVCYLLALQYGGQSRPWSSSPVIGTLSGFGVLLIAGLAWDRSCAERALLQPRLLRIRAIWAACPFVFFLTGNYSIMLYFIPLYFQSVTGASAQESGVRTLALVLPLSGILIKQTGYYKPLLVLGSALAALASGLIVTWDVRTSAGRWIGYQILLGAGMGLSGQGSIVAAQAAVGSSDIAPATATVLFFQTISGAFFISAANCVFANQLKAKIRIIAPEVNPEMLFGQGGAANLGQLFTGDTLDAVLQAYISAMRSAYALALASGGLAFLFSFAAEWKKINLDATSQEPGLPSTDSKHVEAGERQTS